MLTNNSSVAGWYLENLIMQPRLIKSTSNCQRPCQLSTGPWWHSSPIGLVFYFPIGCDRQTKELARFQTVDDVVDSFTYGENKTKWENQLLIQVNFKMWTKKKKIQTKEDFEFLFFCFFFERNSKKEERKREKENTRVMHNTCPSCLYTVSPPQVLIYSSRYHGKHEEIRKQPLKQFTAELVLPVYVHM
jgi:hypothetical protein